MEKITNSGQLMDKYGHFRPDATSAGMDAVGITPGFLDDENFWQVREQCRINDGTYTPIHIDGDDKMRFLHVSIDDPAKVSYTKNAEKGKQDIQTRTTLAKYCEKFGLEMPAPRTAAQIEGTLAATACIGDLERLGGILSPEAKAKTSIREKLGMIQDLIDEVLVDLG